jgi:hypothetical protein
LQKRQEERWDEGGLLDLKSMALIQNVHHVHKLVGKRRSVTRSVGAPDRERSVRAVRCKLTARTWWVSRHRSRACRLATRPGGGGRGVRGGEGRNDGVGKRRREGDWLEASGHVVRS